MPRASRRMSSSRERSPANLSEREQSPPIDRAAISMTQTPSLLMRNSPWIGPDQSPSARAVADAVFLIASCCAAGWLAARVAQQALSRFVPRHSAIFGLLLWCVCLTVGVWLNHVHHTRGWGPTGYRFGFLLVALAAALDCGVRLWTVRRRESLPASRP